MWGASPDEDCTRDERAREDKNHLHRPGFRPPRTSRCRRCAWPGGWIKRHGEGKGTALAATLEDNAASRDFVAQLPLDLTLEDYNATEKIADLPSRLSTEGTPEGVDPDVGDVTYFAPWGNLALFYRDFRYSRGLIRLGRIDGDVKLLERDGSIAVRIERVQRQG